MGVKGDPGGGVTSSGPSTSPSGPAGEQSAAGGGPSGKAAEPAEPDAAEPGKAAEAKPAAAEPEKAAKQADSAAHPEKAAGRPAETASGGTAAGTTSGPPAGPRWQLRVLIRTHWLFVLVLVPAIALRVITMIGFRWALWFNDSYGYVSDAAGTFKPDTLRPSGYSVFLRILEPLHSFGPPVILQHLMGLAIGVMIYAVAVHRFRVPKPIAVVATLPALFDGNQIELEHLLMADVPFAFLVTAAATVVLWRKRPTTLQFALAGGLLGLASVTRTAGLPLLAVLAVYMLIQRTGWRTITAAVLACLVPLGGYMLWFFAFYGKFSTTEATGLFMYSRVMAFADCNKINLPPEDTALCTTVRPSQRPVSQWYLWGKTTPLLRFPPPRFGPLQNRLGEQFALKAIEAQPLAYVNVIWQDTDRAFWWSRPEFPDPLTYAEYEFSNAINGPSRKPAVGLAPGQSEPKKYAHGSATTQIVQPYANVMIWYQRHIWMPGTPLAVLLIVGAGGIALGWRRWGGEILLPWGLSVGLLLIPAATAEFDYRYVLPAIPFACLAAAMIFGEGEPIGDRLLARLERRSAARAIPVVPKEPAAVDRMPSPPSAISAPAAETAAAPAAGPAAAPDAGSGAGEDAERPGEQNHEPQQQPESTESKTSQSGSGPAGGGSG